MDIIMVPVGLNLMYNGEEKSSINPRRDPVGDMTDDLYGKVKSDMDPFKKIASKIPGFAGYVERQSRRDADKLLRTTLANRFYELEDRVSDLQRQFISEGEIGQVDDLEAAAIKLRTFADRVRTAERGYSGLFDAVMINEEELGRLYQYDAAMLDLVDEVNRAIDHVASSVGTEGLPATIRNLESTTARALDVLNKREEVVLGDSPEETTT
jgi:hypothetical protein